MGTRRAEYYPRVCNPDLLNMSIVGPIDELLQLRQAVGLRQGENQLRFHVGLAGLLAGHHQELHQVLPVSCT